MDANVVRVLTVFTVILVALPTKTKAIASPNNVTVRRGSWATITCDIPSSVDVLWTRYMPRMDTLYISSKPQNLNTAKYAVENSSSLVVKDTDFSDGVTYSCVALVDQMTTHYANLVIIDNLTASVYPRDIVSFDDNVTMTCSLNYNGPNHDNLVYPLSPDQNPSISMFLGNEDLTPLASEVDIPGTTQQSMRTKILSVNRTLMPDDIKKELRCYVRSIKPVYEDSANMSLPFMYSPRTVIIEVGANVTNDMRIYTGTIVNCSADGIPAPRVTWMSIGKNPSFEILRTEPGYSVLKLVGPGYHNWNCTASSVPGVAQAYSELNLTVIDSSSKPVESKTGSVGLGVGLGIGLGIPILLGVILLIIFLRKKKSSGKEKIYSTQKKSLFGKTDNSSGVEKTAMIYKPHPINNTRFNALPTNLNGILQNPNRSYDRGSDASHKLSVDSPGHADLGIKTVGASGSMPRLNESFDSADERNFKRQPRSRDHSSYDDDQYYPTRYHKTNAAQNHDSEV